jgi:hypothetical protein
MGDQAGGPQGATETIKLDTGGPSRSGSSGSSGRGSSTATKATNDLSVPYKNVLRAMYGREYNNPRLVAYAVRAKMTATQFATYVRLKDKNYASSVEFQARQRDLTAAWREMMGDTVVLSRATALKFVRGDYSAGAMADYIRGTKEYQDLYPGITQDTTPAAYRTQIIGANTLAQQYWGRDLTPAERAMLFQRGVSNEQLGSNLGQVGAINEGARFATGAGITPEQQEDVVFSGRLSAALRSRGARGLAMQDSMLKTKQAGAQFSRRDDGTLTQPLI